MKPKSSRFAKAMVQASLCVLLTAPAHAQTPADKIVWAHQMGVMPNDSGMQYGSTYPITIFNLNDPVARANFPRQFAKDEINSGITGIAFEVTPGHHSNAPGVAQYEATVKTFASSGLLIAPCIDIGKEPAAVDDIIEAIERSYVVAKQNANPALMPDGRLIVFLYTAINQSVDAWTRMRGKLAADGYKVFLVGDVSQANIGVAKAMSNAAASVAGWDAAFNFPGTGMAGAADSNANFNKTIAAHNKMWVGSVAPGYYRGVNVSPAWGPFGVDALGTARLRSTWQDILQSNIRWVYWITQNDFVEHTNLMPDSSWGYTRSDMNLWFARKFTKSPYPYGPALYLTTPQALHAGGTSVVELAVINPLGRPLSANLQIVADNGDVIGSAHVQAAAHQLDAVQIALPAAAGARYRYARAIAQGPGGPITSAPILLSKLAKLPGDHGVTNYYSVNSRLTTPRGWHPILSSHGNEVQLSGVDANAILSVDLLASGNMVDQVKFPPAGPIALSKTRILPFGRDSNDNKNSKLYADPDVYLVRIVLKNGSIWHSDPLR